MTALRTDLTPKDEEEAQREAHMRQDIRAAESEGFKRIAVVCGAWHTPALARVTTAKADADLLGGPEAYQGRGDLDSLDELAALLSQRLRRGRRLARLVRAPLVGARPHALSAGWRVRRVCCATRGWMSPRPA